MSPLDHLNTFNRQFSDAKDAFKSMQQWYVKNKPKSGLFVPSTELHGLSPRLALANATGLLSDITTIDSLNDKQFEVVKFLWGCHLFGTWRNTMGVYRIDSDIATDLITSPIPSDTPANIFSRLPEWCVYVEVPENSLTMTTIDNLEDATPIRGFWALFDIDNGHQVLNLVLNIDQKENSIYSCYQPLTLIVDEELSIYDAVDGALHTSDAFSAASEDREIVQHLLSLLLWLCAEEPDISNINGEPIPSFPPTMPQKRINKKTGAFTPPNQPIVYDIGKRLGGEIRSFKDKIEQTGKTTSRKRPHIRRGHWHGVWGGTGQDKKFKVYWQPAIFVNGS